MKNLTALLTISYLITWFSGIYNARQKRFDPVVMRRTHLGLSLVT